jgi:cyclopropane-fatty-acyl-phospholipid synthase
VTYWDGSTDRFGNGAGPMQGIEFKTPMALVDGIVRTSLGLGEAYMRGDVVITKGDLAETLITLSNIYLALSLPKWVQRMLTNASRSMTTQQEHVEHHYGRGDEFYDLYLDAMKQYSCAYFRTTQDSLDLAQEQKIAHTVRKLHLHEGQQLLDIGCGWGHLMFHAAETYGVSCYGITICENQAAYIRKEAARRQLPVQVKVMNYLELPNDPQWDRIVSVGMMCHIGEAHIGEFYDKVASLLAPRGIALLHCIAKMKEASGNDPFVAKHVFPGYWFNSIEGMTSRAVDRGLHVLDSENLRRHYALTGRHWLTNFRKNWDQIKQRMGYDDVTMRMWEFYLASVVAAFTTGHAHLIQMVLSNGVNDEYPWTREFIYENNKSDRPLYIPEPSRPGISLPS